MLRGSSEGGLAAFLAASKAILTHQIVDNWLQMRAQLVWGLHESEGYGDTTLLVWDPSAPLMDHGVPYIVTGTVAKKTYTDIQTSSKPDTSTISTWRAVAPW